MKLFAFSKFIPVLVAAVTLIYSGNEAFSTIRAQQDIVDNAKNNILKITSENALKIDNFQVVREQLSIEIEKLIANTPVNSSSLSDKLGVWKQLWTDDLDDLRANNAFQKTDKLRTYQVVFDNGIFYNLTEVKTLFGRFSGFLRGVYEVNGDDLQLEFTKIRLKRGNLGEENELKYLTRDFEIGKVKNTFKIPFASDKYPNGPVGAKGTIRTIYIDKDLRIDIGSNDADGVEDLFILQKIGENQLI
ncbi:PAP/fibrillin family protein [bacterium]|nr:PAP/fibrillin family protein [bacterium]